MLKKLFAILKFRNNKSAKDVSIEKIIEHLLKGEMAYFFRVIEGFVPTHGQNRIQYNLLKNEYICQGILNKLDFIQRLEVFANSLKD